MTGSIYFEALHEAIRRNDPVTGTLRYTLILQTLKIVNHLLTINPHAESVLSPLIERIGICLSRLKNENNADIQSIKELHSSVVEKAEYIYKEKQEKSQIKTKSYVEHRPPPDNFRLLKIIPSMNEILSHERIYLRSNIVEKGGSYEDSNHYLDIHFRLLREDFLSPLREGIQTYLTKSSARNTDIRIYENVYSLGPKVHSRYGLIYRLQLDKKRFRKFQWSNS